MEPLQYDRSNDDPEATDIEDNAQRAELAERNLQEGEERLRAILDNAYNAFISMDQDGRIINWNPAAETMFGWPRSEALGRRLADTIIPSGSRMAHERGLRRYMETGVGRILDRRIRMTAEKRDGTYFPVELSIRSATAGGKQVFDAFIADITDRERAEYELAELNRTLEQRVVERSNELLKSEARYHNALDSMTEGVQIIGFDWRYLYLNDSAVAQSQYAREELLGHTIMEKYPGIEATELFKVLGKCMLERSSAVMENSFTFGDGSVGHYELSIQPAVDGLFILSTDITARKKAELEIKGQSQRLERQNKELEQFTFIASHDLQEPLRMISSYLQLLQRRYADRLDQDAYDFIAFAVDGAQRMKNLINDLLVYSRLDRPLEMAEVDMNAVVQETLLDLDPAIKESAAIITCGPLPHVHGARSQFLQLVQNLLSNAIKFRRPDRPPRIRMSVSLDEGIWTFSVEDNGVGMDEQFADKLFLPFKRLASSSQYAGTGIGLAIAKKTVERYGGRIWFRSKPGEGTTFYFTLPNA